MKKLNYILKIMTTNKDSFGDHDFIITKFYGFIRAMFSNFSQLILELRIHKNLDLLRNHIQSAFNTLCHRNSKAKL
jgi:hypothetical protein